MKKIFRRKWLIALVVLVAVGGWWAGSLIWKGKAAEGQALENMQTMPLVKGEMTRSLLLSGTVRSQNSRSVYAPSSLKVTEVLVKEGDAVKAGQKLATLASSDLALDIKSAELNLENSKEALKSAGTDKQNAIATAKASVESAGIEVENARRQYKETKAQVEKNPSAAVLSAQADLKTAERQLAISRGQAEGQAGSAVLSAKKEVEIAQRQYDLLKQQTEQQSGSSIVSAKKELEIAQRQYDTLKNQAQGTPGNAVLSAKKELEIAQRTYDQLTAQGDAAPAVQSARKDLEIAERAYRESQLPIENTAAVKSARSDLNAALNKYAQLQKGKPLSEQAALNRYNGAVDSLNQAQSAGAARVNQATVDVQNADRDYRAAAQQYEASKTTDNPQGDPALKTAADQANAALKDKQNALAAASQAQTESVKAAQDAVSSSNLDYRQAVEGSADALEQARLAAERAQMIYDAAVKGAADAKITAKDTFEKASQAYTGAIASAGEARVNAADALEKSKQAYEAALGGASDSLAAAQDTLEKAQQAYDNAAGSAKEALTASRDTLDKAKQAYQNANNSAKEAYAASQESLDKLKIGYESALKNQSEAFATAASALERAENGYETAQLNQQIAESKTEEAAQLAIKLQEVSLEKLRKQLADTVIKAPIDGTVTFKNASVDQFANGLMFTVEDTGKLSVSAVVSESDIGSVKVGQNAFVKTESTGEEELGAKLSHIGASAVKSAAGEAAANTNVQFAADVDLLQADPRIRIGMNARMTVVLDRKENVFSVPLDALTTGSAGEDVIYVLQNGKLQEMPVQTGLQNDVMIEIAAPELSEGMNIVSYAQEALDVLQASPELKGEAASNDPDA